MSAPISARPNLQALRQSGVLTDEVAKQLASAGAAARLRSPRVKWDEVLDRYQSEKQLGAEDLAQLEKFTKSAILQRRAIEKRTQEARANELTPAKRDLEKLRRLDAYLEPALALQQAYLESTARTAVQAVAGASFGPLATVAAYLAHNPASQPRTETLVENLKQLESRTSSLVFEGNSVKPVHQELLWKTKLTLLNQAIDSARAGKPQPIDVQYFEMTSSSFVGKLAEAARHGCPIRINIDPSRPMHNDTADLSVDDGPRKIRALLQLLNTPGAQVGISIFPVVQELGSNQELMHRKLLRVGDQVLLSGMNANEGSGENYDTGYLVQGPLAKQLGKEFEADLKRSAGVTVEQVYGEKMVDDFREGVVALTPHGLATTLDAMSGPTPAGTRIPAKPSYEQLQELAARAKVDLGDLVDEEELQKQLKKGSRQPIELKDKGTRMLSKLFKRVFEIAGSPENLARLEGSRPVSGERAGDVTMALGSTSEQREAVILQAIASAEKFIYVPTFVITKAIARALVARKGELDAQGKQLDVRVIADAGVYGYGGTPNSDGYLALEDAGIPVRWSMLTRIQADHDRKIHAKQILTDKMELVGSTNLSNKGIRDNHEFSGLVYFDESSAQSMAAREDGVRRFKELWEREAVALDTQTAVANLNLDHVGSDEARKKAIRVFLGQIQNYELQTAGFIAKTLENPAVEYRALQLHSEGMAYGYARLIACQETLGMDAFYGALGQLPMRKKMDKLNTPGSPGQEE